MKKISHGSQLNWLADRCTNCLAGALKTRDMTSRDMTTTRDQVTRTDIARKDIARPDDKD